MQNRWPYVVPLIASPYQSREPTQTSIREPKGLAPFAPRTKIPISHYPEISVLDIPNRIMAIGKVHDRHIVCGVTLEFHYRYNSIGG
jgi:hypothetical protein